MKRGTQFLSRSHILALLRPFLLGIGRPARVRADDTPASKPRIVAVERHGTGLLVRASVPAGIARVVLEGSAKGDLKAWLPRGVKWIGGTASDITFEIAADGGMELFRVRADATDPLPASFYSGRTNFPGDALAGPPPAASNPGGIFPGVDLATPGAGGTPAPRSVVESDIWVVRDDTLYFFNQYRGLQTIDITHPDAPKLVSTFPLPGAGEQMYLLDDRNVVLLADDPCRMWGIDAASAVMVVDTSTTPPTQRASLPLHGRIVESRLVGTALYVATESWEPVPDGSGAWQGGTYVASFDLSDPATPVIQKPLWFPGTGNVVTATDRFLFVAITDWSQNWPWKSDLQVVDITSPDGAMSPYVRIPLSGRVADKFKLDLLQDVLRVVVESAETAGNGRFVTVLETIRIPDPQSAGPGSYVRLDRLELARGERLYATRFDGDRGYFVTFHQIDPLWVIDLSDATALKVAGHLEIPGFSTYIRPLGDRLLTMGVDSTQGWRVAVQLFDVSDPARPALLSKVPLGEDSSWSEANNDEKAFGVIPEAGLLLVPVSTWGGSTLTNGVQLIDLGHDNLTRRGLLKSDDVVPRRATYHQDRVLAISGRQLVTADVSDRDQPKPSATLELSYSVDRDLVFDGHLIEVVPGGLRIRSIPDAGAVTTSFDLGGQPILGAAIRGDRLHLLQGYAASVQWEYVTNDVWITKTNPGALFPSVWDVSALPALVRIGDATTAVTSTTWLGDLKALWLKDDLLVWTSDAQTYWPWMLAPGIQGGATVDLVGGALPMWPWWAWWGGSGRTLLAVSLDADGTPRLASELTIGTDNGESVGNAFSSGPLVFDTRQRYESEVTGTNVVVEKIWFLTDRAFVTNIIIGIDGTVKTDITKTQGGEWRDVTNSYPILRWWSRHELDVIDYAADPAAPLRRPAIPAAGPLQGVSHGGALLYSTPTRTDTNGNQTISLEADAYDGVALHWVDSVPIADSSVSETQTVLFREADGFVARGGWATNSVQRLEAWRISDTGKWERKASVPLSAAPGQLVRFHDALIASNGGQIDLFRIAPDLDAGDPLVRLPVTGEPGCLGVNVTHGDGDSTAGVWLPQWDYGSVRLGP